ncbi:hypothetical protein VM1G_06698 [Cytospora mali]|uniref:Uncharacterized protein n=1 Tax=Cytospora mali TaxID=578113 RepID=A0A194W646_CYTMA|nr:hypothetical protein VM1G_06698 [Valsa mali]
MFDVDWSDPNRESVGDRRARKKKERESKGKGQGEGEDNEDQGKRDDQQSSQASGYGSVRSSVSSVDKQFAFFGGKHRRKARDSAKTRSTKTKSTKTQSTASSSLRSPTIAVPEQEPALDETASVLPSVAPSASPQVPTVLTSSDSPGLPHKRPSNFSESVFKKWDESAPGGSLLGCDMANPKPGTKTVLTQDLGDGVSSITKSIEIISRARFEEDVEYLVSETAISTSDGENVQKDLASSKPTHWQPPPQITEKSHHLPTVPESPSSPNLEEARHLAPIISESTASMNRDFSRTKFSHRPKPRLNAPPIVASSQQHIGNPCLWKAPDNWRYTSTETAVATTDEPDAIVPTGSEEQNRVALDLASMQREATRMLQASPQTILLRLKGTWGGYDLNAPSRDDPTNQGDSTNTALESALTYKELEMEKKRWMLRALGHMEPISDPNGVLSKPKVKPKQQRILSLFDNQATASYLAYTNTDTPVYHLSPDPLSRKQYPNIHPMHCPFISASSVSLGRETYTTVNSISIASMVPSSEIPNLLGRIHQVLARGGSLNIAILDPLPSARSAGPALRQWLDENLTFNLEQQFRCTNPSRNFPVWLQEARLRARGSVITTTRFQAVSEADGGGGGSGSEESDMEARRELRTVVGRMLWQDIWGAFVTADRWWWDVPEIVDECVGMDTHWEYSIIMACKESDG